MEINLLAFLSLYQYMNYRQFYAIYGDDPTEGEEKMEPFVLTWNERKIKKNRKEGIFYCLLNFSTIHKSPQISAYFAFIEKIYTRDKFQLFGKNYSFDLFYGINKETGKIIVIDAKELKFRSIAKNELSFLLVLQIYLEYSLIGKEADNNDLTKAYREKCITAAGGKEYEEYYSFIFPLEHERKEFRVLQLINI